MKIWLKSAGLYLISFFFCHCSSPDESVTSEVPQPPDQPITVSCDDGIQNGNETGTDCGGAACVPCPDDPADDLPEDSIPEPYEGYTLVWNDEFNTSALDKTKWDFHLGNGCPSLCWWGNYEEQYFTNLPQNVFLHEGKLIIRAVHDSIAGHAYSSARLHSDNLFEVQYGRIDILAKFPRSTGAWSALWLINQDFDITQPELLWPSGGEIDIAEHLGEQPGEIMGTAHYGTNWENHYFDSGKTTAASPDFTEDFHLLSVLWEEDRIIWYVNHVEYHRMEPPLRESQDWPFNDSFYFILSLSVGGTLPANPIAEEFPAELKIEYIRVYKKAMED